jgi:hypothetical protein
MENRQQCFPEASQAAEYDKAVERVRNIDIHAPTEDDGAAYRYLIAEAPLRLDYDTLDILSRIAEQRREISGNDNQSDVSSSGGKTPPNKGIAREVSEFENSLRLANILIFNTNAPRRAIGEAVDLYYFLMQIPIRQEAAIAQSALLGRALGKIWESSGIATSAGLKYHLRDVLKRWRSIGYVDRFVQGGAHFFWRLVTPESPAEWMAKRGLHWSDI